MSDKAKALEVAPVKGAADVASLTMADFCVKIAVVAAAVVAVFSTIGEQNHG